MLKWTIKSLFSHTGTLIASSLGIAAAFILVIFFSAVWRGESEQIVAYPEKMSPDLWVMQKGVANMHMSMSFVWDWKAELIRKMPEVKNVTPILYLNSVIVVGEKKLFGFVVGLLSGDSRAGPWDINQGRTVKAVNEIVIPTPIATLANVKIGDKVQISERAFTIVGFSNGTYSSANPVFFTRFEDLENVLDSFGTYSYLMVDANDDVNTNLLIQKIMQKVDKVNALSHEKFVSNDFELAKQMGVEIILIMTLICSVLAALIVGYSSYSLVNQKRKELAILKAIGATNRTVFISIISQSMIVTSIAYLVALIFALTLLPAIPALVPQITVKLTPSIMVELGFIAAVVAIAGALVPAYKVVQLDPAIAYQN